MKEIDNWIQSEDGMTKETVADIDKFFEEYSSMPPTEILVEGQPWGAVEGAHVSSDMVGSGYNPSWSF